MSLPGSHAKLARVPRYVNLDGTTPDKGFRDIWRWQVADRLAGRRPRADSSFVTPRRYNDGSALRALDPHITWIGHATFVFRLGGALIATDPVFATRMGPSRRLVPPGVQPSVLPAFDIATVSHSHYDHMDLPSLRALAQRGAPLFVVPKDNASVLRAAGIERVVELAWWESVQASGVRVTCVPAQHWSMRVPWDRNTRLWGGFLYEAADGVAYHAGDTAMSNDVFARSRSAALASIGRCCRSERTTPRGSCRRSTWDRRRRAAHGRCSARGRSSRCTGGPSG
jgi:L-ascorbate metabolism protein UlaG (beta-lactamase superfamily)